MLKRTISVLMIICLLLTSAISSSALSQDDPLHGIIILEGEQFYPSNHHNLPVYGHVRLHHLIQNADNTLTVLAVINDYNQETCQWDLRHILLETFSADGRDLLDTKIIPRELTKFGGFFSGEKYNFLVFGQDNEAEDFTAEEIRVVKYSKDWKRLGAASVRGTYTAEPFNAGNLSMAESNGKLFVHTCHIRYDSHQSNLTFVVDEEKNTVADFADPDSLGFVSHSFDQYIRVYGNDVFLMDLGDSNPRAIKITRAPIAGAKKPEDVKITKAIDLTKTGYDEPNWTGAEVGGFEVTKDTIITTGAVVNYEDYDIRPDDTMNLFIAVTDKSLKSTKVKMLTSYNRKSKCSVSKSQLVKINDNKLLLIWYELNEEEDTSPVTKYAAIDASGNLISPIYSNGFPISDCKPILCRDGKLRWFAGPFFNCFNKDAQVYYYDTKKQHCLYTLDPSELASSDGIFSLYGNGDRSGFCGDCFWSLDGSELTITGNGLMDDYTYRDVPPWIYDYYEGNNIKKVTIGHGVENIGSYAFTDCKKLSDVSLPSSVTRIGDAAFDCCSNLESISIPTGVTSIGDCAFRETALSSVTIPASVKSIGASAFSYSELSEVTISSGVTNIGDEAFSGCESLTSVTIPASVKSIGKQAFNYTGLTSVTISEGVTSIGDYAFFNTNLSSVTIPSSVKQIGQYAFYWLSNIKGYEGTAAEKYARDYDIEFISLGKAPAPTPLGDVDGDGEVTIIDATAIQRHIADLPTAAYHELFADADGDGSVTILDATAIQRYLAEMPTNKNIGKPL